MRKYAMKWVYMTGIFFWGLLSFMFLAGEENPNDPMPIWLFISIKAVAMVSFVLCFIIGRYLNQKGLLPDIPEED